jgi:hypothetical protein
MNMYFINNEAVSPPQDLLLEHLLPLATKQVTRNTHAQSPKEVASVIADKLMQLVENRFEVASKG